MNTHSHPFAILAATLALGFATPSFASEAMTEAQIAAARTPAEHEAMARTYKSGGTPKGNSAAMVGHCERLAKSYRTAATEYRALAAEHRKLAAAVN